MKSVLKQDISPNEYEIIVVDDGSIDSSCSIANSYTEKHENIHLFRQKNEGAGAARNKVLEIPTGNGVTNNVFAGENEKLLFITGPADWITSIKMNVKGVEKIF